MIWVGTSGFQYAEWKGKFYPKELSAGKMLAFYAERFSTTEINYTFRRLPSTDAISNWAAGTPGTFRFSFKAPQQITHFARLVDCSETLERFVRTLMPMKRKLGPVLFQLPPNFKKDASRLQKFLETLVHEFKGFKGAFEFRHESWFDDQVFTLLRRHKVALCIAESEEFVTPTVATAAFGYLRLRREDYTSTQLRKWAKFVQGQKWRETFVYFKHEERAVGPKFAAQFGKLLE